MCVVLLASCLLLLNLDGHGVVILFCSSVSCVSVVLNDCIVQLKVLWRSGVILWLWSQNCQVEWVQAPIRSALFLRSQHLALKTATSPSHCASILPLFLYWQVCVKVALLSLQNNKLYCMSGTRSKNKDQMVVLCRCVFLFYMLRWNILHFTLKKFLPYVRRDILLLRAAVWAVLSIYQYYVGVNVLTSPVSVAQTASSLKYHFKPLLIFSNHTQ